MRSSPRRRRGRRRRRPGRVAQPPPRAARRRRAPGPGTGRIKKGSKITAKKKNQATRTPKTQARTRAQISIKPRTHDQSIPRETQERQ